jgi:hypothetical protein
MADNDNQKLVHCFVSDIMLVSVITQDADDTNIQIEATNANILNKKNTRSYATVIQLVLLK